MTPPPGTTATTDSAAADSTTDSATGTDWWRTAVIYQVYPRSFADSDGDGLGDLPGITAHLPYLRDLGVDAVWISPFYPSPQKDAGYDVADYRDVDPRFGTLADADTLITTAHDLGLRIIVDLVPNHTSDAHEWFRAALASPPGSPERDRYLFRDIDPAHPDVPPNNWGSNFGGPAWSKTSEITGTTDGDQWYLHLFDSSQPDLNWENPQVRDAFDDILRFWLDRGVDGFRVDVAHGMVKEPGLPDAVVHGGDAPEGTGDADATMASASTPYWDRDGVHEIYRRWRRILDSYGPADTADPTDHGNDRIMVAEAWVQPVDRIARYVRPDEHHQAFNFAFIDTRWNAAALRETVRESYRVNDAVGAPTTWVLSNHDVIRHATRLALAPGEAVTQLAGPVTEPDRATGLARARSATTLMLGLPGSAYLYQGEELGLPEVLDIPDDARQDPTFFRTRHTAHPELGRDGCRVPLPWHGDAGASGVTGHGFGPARRPDGTAAAAPWLPQPEIFADLAVDRQTGDPDSTLELYRTLLRLRRELGLAGGHATVLTPATGPATGPDTGLVTVEVTTESGPVTVVTNLGPDPWPVPAGQQVAVASAPGVTATVPTDCTVWLTRLGSPVE